VISRRRRPIGSRPAQPPGGGRTGPLAHRARPVRSHDGDQEISHREGGLGWVRPPRRAGWRRVRRSRGPALWSSRPSRSRC